MKKKAQMLLIIVFVILAACFITFQITYTEIDNLWKNKVSEMMSTEITELSDDFAELSETVGSHYLGKVNETAASENAMRGYVEALDRYSMYMDEKEYQNYLALQSFATDTGIGVNTLYDSTLDGIYVVNVYKGSPAESKGLVPGDIITHVEGTSVKELGFYGAMSILATGTSNTAVNVTLKKLSGSDVTISITRSFVKPETILGEKLGNGIGLITIKSFVPGDEELFKSTLETLITKSCEKFVIDVRNNSGGSMETVSRILDFLLGGGELFTVTDNSGATNTVISDTNSVPYPLAVLINEGTVCGAEVFAAAMRQEEGVKLFGTRTYGKAVTQNVFALPSGGAVSVSTTMYTPKGGVNFEGVGVMPDEVSELSLEMKSKFTVIDKKDDAPLQAAISYLKTQEIGVID